MTTYAAVSDVSSRWGRTPSDDESTLITVRLADVERMIKRRIPDLDDQLSADPPTIDVEDVKQVEADAVLRLVRNSEGYVSETDGSYTYQFSEALISGTLEILPAEWGMLGLASTAMSIVVPVAVVPAYPPRCLEAWDWCP